MRTNIAHWEKDRICGKIPENMGVSNKILNAFTLWPRGLVSRIYPENTSLLVKKICTRLFIVSLLVPKTRTTKWTYRSTSWTDCKIYIWHGHKRNEEALYVLIQSNLPDELLYEKEQGVEQWIRKIINKKLWRSCIYAGMYVSMSSF